MKINQMVHESRLIEIDIELPYFCKSDEDTFIKVITEDRILVVKTHNLWSQILLYELMSGHHSDIAKGQQITEQEFNEACHKALFEIGKYVPAPNTDYLDYVESKIEIGEVPLMMQEWKHLNQAIEQ